ncbi:MAG TPA: choice-of-anchor D domain-containing protein [Candidatus Sulfotelmatobacter sp.]
MRQRQFFGMLALVVLICVSSAQLTAQAPTVPTVSFAPAVNYSVGSLPFACAVADFNRDGILDIAVVNSDPYSLPDTVSVLLGKGDGTFEPAVNYTVDNEPDAIVAVDLNGDGAPDIATADELGKTMDVLINKADGSGTFNAPVAYAAGQAPRGIAAGDLRGIGKIDLVVANNLGNNVTVFLANGDGTFAAGINYPANQHPKSVAIGKFVNGSTHLDLAIANHDSNDVSILIGNGDGTFQAPVNYAVGKQPRHVVVADFNRDGNLDLATANGGATTVSILYGNGNGTFQKGITYAANASPRWLVADDFNGDGIVDLVTSDYNSADVSVLLGTGTTAVGTAFLSALHYKVSPNPTGIASGDFNADGKPDLAVTIGGVPTAPNTLLAVLLNQSAVVSPSTLTFPNQVLKTTSAPMTVTLTNTAPNSLAISSISIVGTQAVDFGQTNNCGTSLSGGASCTISVTFTPQAVNGLTATLQINDSAPGGSQTVALKGTGTAAQVAPTSLSFAAQPVGTTSAAQTVTLTNVSGNATITISDASFTGANAGDFAQTNTCNGSVAPKKSCTFSVTFTPTAIGARTAALSLTDNAGGSPQSVPVSGTGTTSVSVTPTSITFPTQVLNTTSAPQPVTLTNGTASALAISSIAVSGGNASDFPETNNCGTSLASGSSCTINVSFKPTNINHRASTLTITDGAGTQTVPLSGTSTAAALAPTSLTFSAQTVGTTSDAQTITLSNASGSSAISISSIGIAGTDPTDFAQSNNCGTSVAQKKSCTISVTFTPLATGTRTATLSVTDNAGGSPQTATLTGTGQ